MAEIVAIRVLSVVIPCFNEAGEIQRFEDELFPALQALQIDFECIFVDDGSTDATPAGLKRTAARFPFAKIVTHPSNLGLGRALRSGFDVARGDAVLTLDADLTFHPRDIKRLVAAFEPDVSCVAGSPTLGRFQGVSWHRLAMSRAVNALYRLALGGSVTAASSIFRLYRRADLDALNLRSNHFDINAEILVKLLRRKAVVREVPVTLGVRTSGTSKIDVRRETVNHLSLLWRIFWRRI